MPFYVYLNDDLDAAGDQFTLHFIGDEHAAKDFARKALTESAGVGNFEVVDAGHGYICYRRLGLPQVSPFWAAMIYPFDYYRWAADMAVDMLKDPKVNTLLLGFTYDNEPFDLHDAIQLIDQLTDDDLPTHVHMDARMRAFNLVEEWKRFIKDRS